MTHAIGMHATTSDLRILTRLGLFWDPGVDPAISRVTVVGGHNPQPGDHGYEVRIDDLEKAVQAIRNSQAAAIRVSPTCGCQPVPGEPTDGPALPPLPCRCPGRRPMSGEPTDGPRS